MKYILLLLLPLFMLSCDKGVTYYNPPISSDSATVQLCNSLSLPYNSPFNGQCRWDIFKAGSNDVFSNVLWNNNSSSILLSPGTFHIHNYGVTTADAVDTFINYYDTSFSFSAGKVYSLFNLLGRQGSGTPFVSTPNIANLVQESDMVPPTPGFAKIRLIVAVPILGPSMYSESPYTMNPELIFYNNHNDTLKYLKDRYYLDHLNNPSLLNFKTVPAGNYNQLGTNILTGGFAFNLESGKKYTIMVTQMIRTQYPNLDNFYLVKHNF